MSGARCKYAVWVPLVVLAVGTLLAFVTRIDLSFDGRFYDAAAHGWPVGDTLPFHLAYQYGQIVGWVPGVLAAILLIGAIFAVRLRRYTRACTFWILLSLIGPGLLVNAVLKDNWGRPRPRQTQEFGGKYAYQHPWVMGEAVDGRKSFPSGHAAMGFLFLAPYFIYRARNRRAALAWLWGGVAFGLFIGLARMAQGAHWPSDVLWSFGVVYFTAYALARFLHLDRMEKNEQPT